MAYGFAQVVFGGQQDSAPRRILIGMNAKEQLLLTGAGFSKNFGAPLAAELWSLILGSQHLANQPRVREALLADFDFESVYQRVQNGVFSSAERQALTEAVKEVYGYIDSTIEGTPASVNIYGVQKLIESFCGSRQEPGFVFTLNQDLFLERHYYNGDRPILPGVQQGQNWFTGQLGSPTSPMNSRTLPDTAPAVQSLINRGEFFYVKLHGSMNWYSAKGDGMKLVIGQGKEAQIDGEPLLARYMEVFRDALTSGEHKLLVIGYSFADPHINKVLLDSMGTGLRLFVLSPGSPEDLKRRMKDKNCGELWGALVEHFPFDLRALFPADQSRTAQWKHVQRRFFDKQ